MTKAVLSRSPHKIVLSNSIYKNTTWHNIDHSDTKKCTSRLLTLAGNHELKTTQFGVKTAKLEIQRQPSLIYS